MEIYTIGGFEEVGKNMTVLDLGDDAIILDMGIYLPAVIELQEEGNQQNYTEAQLRKIGALPNDKLLDKYGLRNKIRAILLGHAHLDHIGAIPYIGHRYNCPIVGTPFTIEVLKAIVDDAQTQLPNKLIPIQPNGTYTIKGKKRNYKAEFINVTHSTLQTALIAIHTPEGIVLYANDFKLDNTPVMGEPPNYKALERISKIGVKALIVDSLYSGANKKTPSEKVARALLEEVLLTIKNDDSAIFVATFSSHIARIKSIVDFSKKLNREVLVIGRSMNKYLTAAKNVGLCPFSKQIRIGSYKRQVEGMLKKVAKNRKKYLVICTGHQAEEGSILDRLAKKQLPFHFQEGDNIVFSSKTIPAPANIANREKMDKKLRKLGARLFDEVHVSGHGGREDLRDFLSIVKPENIIPSHGTTEQLLPLMNLAKEMGYKQKQLHLPHDSGKVGLK